MGAQKGQPEILQPGTIAGGSLDGCMITLQKHWLKVNVSWKSFLSGVTCFIVTFFQVQPTKTHSKVQHGKSLALRLLDDQDHEDFLEWVSRKNVKTIDSPSDQMPDADATPVAAASLGLATSEVRPH